MITAEVFADADIDSLGVPWSPPAAPPIRQGRIVAVSISPGGIPKLPQSEALVTLAGLAGDGRNHAKHIRPDRAVSLFDREILEQLVREGFPLVPGAAGENLTVAGLGVQSLPPGTLLQVGDVLLQLTMPRKPCYVLDAIDPRLQFAIVGRCGYLAAVVRGGLLQPGMSIQCVEEGKRTFEDNALLSPGPKRA